MSEDLTQDKWLDWSIELAEHAMHIAPVGADKMHAIAALINAAMIHVTFMADEGLLPGDGRKTVKELQRVMLKQFDALKNVEIEEAQHSAH